MSRVDCTSTNVEEIVDVMLMGSWKQDYLLYAIPMLDFEPEFNVGLWTQFSLIKGSNLILELEPDEPIGQFNNVFWTSAIDSISLSKKLLYIVWFNMNHVIHPIETPPRLLAGEGGVCFLKVQSLLLNSGSKSSIGTVYNR